MVLPRYVKLNHLDEGIVRLVINMNRIPGLNTRTTCEGHVWRDTPMWPSKNGWIHFYTDKGKHLELIDAITGFCENSKYFFLDFDDIPQEDRYMIEARFENHVGKHYFKDTKGLEEYLDRADMEKKHILNGWNELNKIVVNYIKQNISQDINNVPYRK